MNIREILVAITFLLLLGLSACGRSDPVSSTDISPDDFTISTLSNRADLISGGDALIRIDLPRGADTAILAVLLNDRDVTEDFTALEPDQQVTGLVDGLAIGKNVLRAHLDDGRSAQLTITNHPIGGPVIAGPQVQPWICTTAENGLGEPLDEQCNAPTQLSYLYQPEDAKPGDYEPYDPDNPPSDVAMTTTDDGIEVPYIIREETGTLNRTIYRLMVLADPRRKWSATQPQAGWNRKLFVSFGGGCGTPHKQTAPPDPGGAFGNTADDGQVQLPDLLARGWMTMGSGLFTLNQNCNETVSAEALMMAKEHIIDHYGEIKRTVSAGGSGGSIQQHYIASAYPGLLDGIVPTQSYPDLWALIWDAAECTLLTRYFSTVSPHLWLFPWQQAAVTGKTGPVACLEFATLLNDAFDPQNRGLLQLGLLSARPGCQIPEAEIYHPTRNPTGTRCTIQDYQRAIWGRNGPLDAAPIPYDNIGVQYGLNALQSGAITPEQFVDLNFKIGGIDNEGNYTAERTAMDETTATTMYRAARTSDPRQLAKVPILNLYDALLNVAPDALADIHQPYHSYVMRARLDAVNGTHANQVIWYNTPENLTVAAVLEIDRWLEAVESDTSALPREEKVVLNKPDDIVDTCWIGGEPVTNTASCEARYPYGDGPRISAGAPWRNDIRKCQLKPLLPENYNVSFTDGQWQRLKSAFPDGVCDWSKPSVGYQPSIPWMTYSRESGGTPLGAAPVSSAQ